MPCLRQRRRHRGQDVGQVREVVGELGPGLLRPDLRQLVLGDPVELALRRAQRSLQGLVLFGHDYLLAGHRQHADARLCAVG